MKQVSPDYMRDFFKECIEDLSIPNEWVNESHGNDACPSFSFNGWQIFINHKDPKQREVYQARFFVFKADEYGESVLSLFLETDEFDHVFKFLEIEKGLNSNRYIINLSTKNKTVLSKQKR